MARGMTALLLALAVVAPALGIEVVAGEGEGMGANPIRRVVSLLQHMAKKVEAEGAKEKELYKEFMCYCTTSGGDLAKAIAESEAKIPQVQSSIEAAEAELKSLKQDLESHTKDREAAKAAMAQASALREKENQEYLKTSGEYKGYIEALGGAIAAIEKGMAGSFLQTQAASALKQAVGSDTKISDYDREIVVSFLAGSAGAEGGYAPQSGEIVGILKQLKDDFEKSLAEVESDEAAAVTNYEGLMEAKTKEVAALTASIEKKTARVGEVGVEKENLKGELSDEEASLIADQKFAANLEENCKTKTAEWEERSKIRAEELVAIHDTIKILNDDDALELFKKTLPSPGASLLQVTTADKLRQKALAVVRNTHRRSRQLEFIALALSGKQVDFSKVIKMIDDMVALLATEQKDDDKKKDFCEKELDTTEDTAKALERNIEDLEKSIDDEEEALAMLASEIKELLEGIAALDKEVAEATENRKKEHEEYQELMTDNTAAKELLGIAKNRLNKFYNPKLYLPPPKRELTEEQRIYSNMGGELEPTPTPGGIANTGVMALAQVSRSTVRMARDAPPPPPETWDAYAKKGQESAGVMTMIDLLVKDLDKEMAEATVEEKDAQNEYEALMSDSAEKRAADTKLVTSKEKTKADTEASKLAHSESKTAKTKELMATKELEMSLHQECDWLLQNFEVRKEARAGEVESLKSAKAILSGADFSLVQRHSPSLRGSA